MNRRQWLQGLAATSATTFLLNNFAESRDDDAPNDVPESHIAEIGIVNMSHTDFGYTDMPTTVWEIGDENLRRAIRYCRETDDYPEEARFRWTIETIWSLEHFLQTASAQEKRDFDRFADEGRIEVTASPGNLTCVAGRREFERELDRLKPIFDRYRPTVALQTDVNGLPWGFVDALLERGVRNLATAVNGPFAPVERPGFFRWGSKEKDDSLLVWAGLAYAGAFDYFHSAPWRRGPVPHRYDVWYDSPGARDIFVPTKENVEGAREILRSRLPEFDSFPYSDLLLSFTNHTTMDNDVPCRQLSDFIRVWNDSGFVPKLVFTTPGAYFRRLEERARADSPIFYGDWSDWWGSGVASTPSWLSLLSESRRRGADVENALAAFGTEIDAPLRRRIDALNRDLLFAAEHVWGAYDSIADPYGNRTIGCFVEKAAPFYRADEGSKMLKRDILRETPEYESFSQTRTFEVFNPGPGARSGWVDVSKTAQRFEADALEDVATGKHIHLQGVATEYDPVAPNGWINGEIRQRFYLANLPSGAKRRFRLIEDHSPLESKTESDCFQLVFDENGGVRNVVYKPLQKALFNESDAFAPGQIVVERPTNPETIRTEFFSHRMSEKNVRREVAELVESAEDGNPFYYSYRAVLRNEIARRIEQRWNFYDESKTAELTTTIWLNETLDPVAAYVAFPFALESPRVFYDSFGVSTEVGRDALPNSCGEFYSIGSGATFCGADAMIDLATRDVPLGVFDRLQRDGARFPEPPKTARFYSLFLETYWPTNFAVLYPTKLVARYLLTVSEPTSEPRFHPQENDEFWVCPCKETV